VLVAAAEAHQCNDGGNHSSNPPKAGWFGRHHDHRDNENASAMHSFTALEGIDHHTETMDDDTKKGTDSSNSRGRRIHGVQSDGHRDVLNASAMHSFTGIEGISHQTTATTGDDDLVEESPVMKHTARKVRGSKTFDTSKPVMAATEMKKEESHGFPDYIDMLPMYPYLL